MASKVLQSFSKKSHAFLLPCACVLQVELTGDAAAVQQAPFRETLPASTPTLTPMGAALGPELGAEVLGAHLISVLSNPGLLHVGHKPWRPTIHADMASPQQKMTL